MAPRTSLDKLPSSVTTLQCANYDRELAIVPLSVCLFSTETMLIILYAGAPSLCTTDFDSLGIATDFSRGIGCLKFCQALGVQR